MQPDSSFPYMLAGLGLAAVGLLVALGIRMAKQRTKNLAAMAERMGFTFVGNYWRGPQFSSQYKTSLLQRIRGRYHNVMIGQVGELQVSIFDYTYQNGKTSVTLTLTCFSQKGEFPPFELRPENIFDKIGDAITHSDVDFESNPEFSRRYHLRTPNEAGIRALFTPSLMTYFEQIAPDKKWHVEASGPSLVIYRHRWWTNAEELPALLNETSAIARMILSRIDAKRRL